MRIASLLSIPAVVATLAGGLLHNQLTRSAPSAGEKLANAPERIVLWFKEKPEVRLTSVILMRGDSSFVANIKAVPGPDTLAAALPVSTALSPGDYLVSWRTTSADGHAIRGSFGFSISP
jgi:methionine-rich copper-binding protein CopC